MNSLLGSKVLNVLSLTRSVLSPVMHLVKTDLSSKASRWVGWPPPSAGKRVIGSANQLNKAGHFVTVYDRNDRMGGLLMYGIPKSVFSLDIAGSSLTNGFEQHEIG
jgi:hypothetical protein